MDLVVFCGVVIGCQLICERNRFLDALSNMEKELATQVKLRDVERAGRISVQMNSRKIILDDNERTGYRYRAIGHIESPFGDRRGTPRQPMLVPSAKGRIRFDRTIIQANHFEEIGQFSHIWVIFVFHENTNTDKHATTAKIKPPRLNGKKVGCLTTRSPHRPNNVGLSVCEVVGRGDDYIDLASVDMVDGTPVLDIKPYIPYDLVPSDYQLPMATTSKGIPLQHRKLTVPNWIVESDIKLRPVMISQEIINVIDNIVRNNQLVHYHDTDECIEFITQVLRQDIRGVHQGRGSSSSQGTTANNSNSSNNSNSVSATTVNVNNTIDSNNKNIVEDETSSLSSSLLSLERYNCRLDNLYIEFVTKDDGIHLVHVSVAATAKKSNTKSDNKSNNNDDVPQQII